MIAIRPQPISNFRAAFVAYAEELPAQYRNDLLSPAALAMQTEPPFIQLRYEELSGPELVRVLGQDICAANSPIGLEGNVSSRLLGTEQAKQVYIFSLAELEQRLIEVEPRIVGQFRKMGSMSDFANSFGDAMTAVDYLVGGILECTRYCKATNDVLTITW